MSTAAVYSSQSNPKDNQMVLRDRLIEKQEKLNVFIKNVFDGVDSVILSDKVTYKTEKTKQPRSSKRKKSYLRSRTPQPSRFLSPNIPFMHMQLHRLLITILLNIDQC